MKNRGVFSKPACDNEFMCLLTSGACSQSTTAQNNLLDAGLPCPVLKRVKSGFGAFLPSARGLCLLVPSISPRSPQAFPLSWTGGEIRAHSDFINGFLKAEVKVLRWKEATHILSCSKLSGGGVRIELPKASSCPVPGVALNEPDQQEREMVTAWEPPK